MCCMCNACCVQLRQVVQAFLESRQGEPPLTGRELRMLVAMLDANCNGEVTRKEFEAGCKECRCGALWGRGKTTHLY